MEDIIKTITTKKGGRVSLIRPAEGHPFFRYEAGANALTDTFRYIIRQHGQEDTATVTVNVEVPVEENTAQQYFNQQMQSILKCMEKFMDGSPATLALTNMLGIDEGEQLNDDWLEIVFDTFKFFDYALEEGQEFPFQDHLGKYIYRKEGYWELEKGDQGIEIYFPSAPDVYENDTVILVKDIKTQQVKTQEDSYHLPTHLDISLSVQGRPYFNLSLNGEKSEVDTEYHEGTGLPVAFDAQLTVAPYTLRATMRHEGQQRFYPSISLSDTDGCKLAADATIQLYEELNYDLNEESIFIEDAQIHVNELTFTGLGSLWQAAQAKAETQEDIDAILNIQCTYKGSPIGQVRFVLADEALMLAYEDGTSQNINDLFMKFMDEYFNNSKADGSARNKAFDFSNDQNYRSAAKSAASVDESALKASAKLTEGFKRRVSRAGVSAEKVAEKVMKFMRGEKHQEEGDYYDPAYDEEMRRYEEEMRRHEEEAKKANEEAEAKAAADAKAKTEADAKAKAADADAKNKSAARAKAAAAARAKKEAEAKAKAAAADASNKSAARAKAAAEAKAKTAADARAKAAAEAEAKKKATSAPDKKAAAAGDMKASSAASDSSAKKKAAASSAAKAKAASQKLGGSTGSDKSGK